MKSINANLLTDAVRSAFLAKTRNAENGCIEWIGLLSPSGYGRFFINRSGYAAHRVAMAIRDGAMPSEYLACHRCDNRRCVNPDHLFCGSNRENIRDMVSKGRHPKCRLSVALADEIRALRLAGATTDDLAGRFGVDSSTIRRIIKGRLWASQ